MQKQKEMSNAVILFYDFKHFIYNRVKIFLKVYFLNEIYEVN